ncbi:riboflavin synthase beta chain [Chlamydia felis Fe/C-56]|uniref:6,7-dimethyl-8-ribityllumazine synthase n=1 Tax=Chlamydia felis (strain Fe/C-56) TaxID=264202 RepID=RISB_CHLFF|nr:6,7-dimethyl-8-ribityllumazine synthase [Chlamydia felis]Q255Z6.1 RecName: Full=6,7-dimethyl-8-ribityllumazine synthase; Short=DMRL synthase; Short=LS; Short=Lumazine synthase [Chlamydia felis Fe/C-56]BAE80892.1 riboflavin synthase beta chain [Chlamydia felis Fe/C-56]
MKILKGTASARGMRVAIVGACFNGPIADALVSGAQQTFLDLGGSEDMLTVVRVPGSFEIPCTLKKLLSSGMEYHAIVACGVLIKGETSHYDLIADQVAARVSELSVEYGLPITFSVITAPSVDSAWQRAGIKGSHLGVSGMETALEMANLFEKL